MRHSLIWTRRHAALCKWGGVILHAWEKADGGDAIHHQQRWLRQGDPRVHLFAHIHHGRHALRRFPPGFHFLRLAVLHSYFPLKPLRTVLVLNARRCGMRISESQECKCAPLRGGFASIVAFTAGDESHIVDGAVLAEALLQRFLGCEFGVQPAHKNVLLVNPEAVWAVGGGCPLGHPSLADIFPFQICIHGILSIHKLHKPTPFTFVRLVVLYDRHVLHWTKLGCRLPQLSRREVARQFRNEKRGVYSRPLHAQLPAHVGLPARRRQRSIGLFCGLKLYKGVRAVESVF
mmetsp:Transcript_31888/g.79964  ORF Transcript_31888/g.79964 Transcript_31888/m.79964 type:complete len:290 (-) Transcript_31888:277-1146(-)|eukprot:CAMPEP_0177641920 /NCGR_PEP_ID=MMETSP0447-20121125/7318_1 /TAXON_ID=0 /ORGANISM="Stygamoeba regulata, Strain BSH-02190019" /LENGTH=289 /DNA_ID=CAMNT_0019144059 /DNA_START=159 /DNA_END=1028 /DNA_ORIENTATION=+